jgi:hypothetical protein
LDINFLVKLKKFRIKFILYFSNILNISLIFEFNKLVKIYIPLYFIIYLIIFCIKFLIYINAKFVFYFKIVVIYLFFKIKLDNFINIYLYINLLKNSM